jgi:hypothetical protein
MRPIVFSILLLLMFTMCRTANAQNARLDSSACAFVLKQLAITCKKPDVTDPKVQKWGKFYWAAPLILYRGKNKKKEWKEFADYTYPEQKEGVDAVCDHINQTINQDPNFRIIQYYTEDDSEGTWHVLTVTYTKKGVESKSSFSFLKIGNRIGLGNAQ